MRAYLAIRTVVIGLCAAGILSAQATVNPSFEVASVRPTMAGTTNSIGGAVEPGGRFTVVNVPLREFIQSAYRVQDYPERLEVWSEKGTIRQRRKN